MFCSNCGKELSCDVKFCQYCGYQVGEVVKNDKPQVVYVQQVEKPKSQFIAVVLCLFLGGFGFHDFYMKHSGRAILKILIAVFLGWIYIGLIINFVWCMLDLVAIIVKSDDCFYTEEELKQKKIKLYNETHYEKVNSYEELLQKQGMLKK